MKLNIIIPTIGRPTLRRLLESIPQRDDVEVIMVCDGFESQESMVEQTFPHERLWLRSAVLTKRCQDYGYTPRNVGLAMATAEWVTFNDDDNYYAPGGVEKILDYCNGQQVTPAAFRMDSTAVYGKVLWDDKVFRRSNVGLPQFVCRNSNLPRFEKHYDADFDWMEKVVRAEHGRVNLLEPITVVVPVQSWGK